MTLCTIETKTKKTKGGKYVIKLKYQCPLFVVLIPLFRNGSQHQQPLDIEGHVAGVLQWEGVHGVADYCQGPIWNIFFAVFPQR